MTGRPRDQGAEDLAQVLEAQRPRLVRLAYATTGSLAEGEYCVQEAWLRLRVPDPESIGDLGAWLTITVSRAGRGGQRERYVGPNGGGDGFSPCDARRSSRVLQIRCSSSR